MTYAPVKIAIALIFLTPLLLPGSANAWEVEASNEITPREFEGVGVTERLGESVDMDLSFIDHTGEHVRLGDLTNGGQPLLITLNYYECPSICTVQLNGLAEALHGVDVEGEEFQVVTLSIDASESTRLANRKRESYIELLDRSDVNWTFMTGGLLAIRQLAEELGFGYRYDPDSGEFAHQPAAFLVSPEGVITRVLYGLQYNVRDLKFALIEAGDGEVGSTIDQIIMTCFHYVDGSYAPWAFGIMRLGGIIVVALMAILLVVLWRRERVGTKAEATA